MAAPAPGIDPLRPAPGIVQDPNILNFFFHRQISFIVLVTQFLFFLCTLLTQPPFIAEALIGVVIFNIGRINSVSEIVFPIDTVYTLETISGGGIIFYGFMAGQNTDLKTLCNPSLESIIVVIIGIPISYAVVAVFAITYRLHYQIIFIGGAALTMTSTASLTYILAHLKLLSIPISRTAVTASILCDFFSWATLIICMVCSNKRPVQVVLVLSLVSIVYMVAKFTDLRSRSWWFSVGDEKKVADRKFCWMMVAVLSAAFATASLGMHAIIGAYLFGLFIPRGSLQAMLKEKMDFMVIRILVPMFYCVIGMSAASVFGTHYAAVLAWAPILALIGILCRICAVVAASLWVYEAQHAVALGLLMNAKGFLPILMLYVAWQTQIIEEKLFVMLYFTLLLMTASITPLLRLFYRPKVKDCATYNRRTIDRPFQDSNELRILACIYSVENIKGHMSLLRATNATPNSPLRVFMLHLIELTYCASSMLIVHNTRTLGSNSPGKFDELTQALQSFEDNNRDVAVEKLVAMSPFPTMQDDICNLAEDHRVAFLLLPFSPQRIITNNEDSESFDYNNHSRYAGVNIRTLNSAPCSVGIFVDRGFPQDPDNLNITMLYFLGPDDREALAYAWRMVRRSGTTLHVVRFLLREGVNELELLRVLDNHDEFEVIEEYERERRLDEEFVKNFRSRTEGSKRILYEEKILLSGEDTVNGIKEVFEVGKSDVCVVGRGEKAISPLTAGHSKWCDYPELGPIGDILVSSVMEQVVSLVVVQRYSGVELKWNQSGPLGTMMDMFDYEEGCN